MGPAALGSQNWGMHPEPRQQSWHSRGEQSFLSGACPCKKQIGFCSGPCEGRKSATLGSSLPKAFPLGGRCPSAHTGADEGAIDSPNGAGEERRWGDRPIFLQGKVGYRIAPSSVTFGDSFPPRGSLWVVLPYTKKRPKSGHVHGHRNSPSTGTMQHNRQNQRVPTSGL